LGRWIFDSKQPEYLLLAGSDQENIDMNRKEFFATSVRGAVGCCALALFEGDAPATAAEQTEAEREKDFVKNWMEDLFDTMYQELDEKTRVRLMAGCGRGCFRRFQFKQDIARLGKGNVDRLIEAYKKNFEVWRDGNLVHIRYGAVNKQCYCPAARYHPVKPRDMHCECTRMTHQTIFETALERPIRVKIVESLRRGGATCHFVADIA
jgi:hypothetical protein